MALSAIIICTVLIAYFSTFFIDTSTSTISLQEFNVRKDAVTISGFSAGASMATHLHISHSSAFHGAALFSQTFYRCGPKSLLQFGVQCSKVPFEFLAYNVQHSIDDARRYEMKGLIDPLDHLKNQRVFIGVTGLDEWVPKNMQLRNKDFYQTFIPEEGQLNVTLLEAKHLFPTVNFGNACDQDASENLYLGNCNYSGAYHALEFLLRDKTDQFINPFLADVKPGAKGKLMAFNQSEFYLGKDIREVAMGKVGYIYVPPQCERANPSSPCFLHLNFHGCNEWPPEVALKYIENNGFLPVADANGIIVVFPLTTKVPRNMDGCWDFYSYTDSLFATKEGKQVKVMKGIIDRILGNRGDIYHQIN